MRFTYRIKKEEISEWSDCYIGYKNLKVILKLLKEKIEDRIEVTKSTSLVSGNFARMSDFRFSLAQMEAQADPLALNEGIKDKCDKANTLLMDTLNKEIEIFGAFSRAKFAQIESRYQKCLNCFCSSSDNKILLLKTLKPYLECIFVETSQLSLMYESNTEAERRILDKHLQYAERFYPTPAPRVPTEVSIHSINRLLRAIEKLYLKVSDDSHSDSRYRLHKLAESYERNHSDSMVVGLSVGIALAIVIFLGIIMGYLRNDIHTDPIFNTDFPTWRGISLFIIYSYLIGVNLHHFEKHSVSHRTIMENTQTKYPTSTKYFIIASIFSIIIAITFTFYLLDISSIITIKGFSSQLLPIFIWVPFIFWLINPISICFLRSRDYYFKTIWDMIICICIPITFPLVYATEQITSLFIPLRDAIYTICYYSHFNLPADFDGVQQHNNCQFPSELAIFIFTLVVFSYRVIQCVKAGFQVKPYSIPDFINAGKYVSCIISNILSYCLTYYRDRVLAAWIVFAAITSIYTYLFDLKYDWLLLDKKSGRLLLRDKITYPKKFYYVLIVVNIFLRCSWVLTISPAISDNFGSREVFLILFAFLEILRRAIWNMLLVEAVHYQNCQVLNVLPQYFFIREKELKEALGESEDKPVGTSESVAKIVENGLAESGIDNSRSEIKDDITKQMEKVYGLVEAKRQKIIETKKYLKESNPKDEELIEYLYKDEYYSN